MRLEWRPDDTIEAVPEETREEEDAATVGEESKGEMRTREMSLKESSISSKMTKGTGTVPKAAATFAQSDREKRRKRRRSAARRREQELVDEISKLRRNSMENLESASLIKNIVLDIERRLNALESGVEEQNDGLREIKESVITLERKMHYYETKGRVIFSKNFDGPLKQVEEMRAQMQKEYAKAVEGLAAFKSDCHGRLKTSEVKYDEVKGKIDALNHSFKERVGALQRGEEYFR